LAAIIATSPRLRESIVIVRAARGVAKSKKRVLFHSRSLVEQTADSISGTWKPSQTYKSPLLSSGNYCERVFLVYEAIGVHLGKVK
jgi:hypothetical protein